MAASVVASPPAQAATATGTARWFHDGLDTRYSSYRLAQAASAAGYASYGYTGGRSANAAWIDARSSSVYGLFGHANAGLFQTNEGSTDRDDQFLAAGTLVDPVSIYSGVRFFSEYLPYVDVDDMRLLILAGCYTANSDPAWGSMTRAATEKGVDASISFPGLVYYPKTAAGTAITNTNYSGNYFWDRFSYYAQGGNDISTALSRARTDLVNKEGNAGGWDRYTIRGSVSYPASTRLTPSGNGTPLTSQPYGIRAYSSFAELTTISSRSGTSSEGDATEVVTEEGVLYRLRSDGTVLDAVAPVATTGDTTVTEAAARESVASFLATNIPGFDARWTLVEQRDISHVDGDEVESLRYVKSVGVGRYDEEVTVELDRRTGAVVYLLAGRTPFTTAAARTTREEAIASALSVADGTGDVTATLQQWGQPRWIVTIDRGTEGRDQMQTPDLEQITVDARTGEVLITSTT
jgi:hypothetical protein